MRDVNTSLEESVILEFQDEIEDYSNLYLKSKNQSQFLKKLFYRIQRKRLVDYANNAHLVDLFTTNKKYDCVTGTALYALVLDALDVDYSIKETDFHVYLLVHLSGKDMLFESTDPVFGFIDNPEVINNRIRSYRTGEVFGASNAAQLSNNSSGSHSNSFNRDRIISLEQLAGLQYYNLATNSFNNQNHTDAVRYMEIAFSLYPNDRFNGFREILLVDMAQSMSSNYSPDRQ